LAPLGGKRLQEKTNSKKSGSLLAPTQRQAAEEERIEFLGLRIGGKARVEIRGIRFDQEDQRVRVVSMPVRGTG